MNTSNTRLKHVSSTVGTIVMALTFAAVIGTISLVPALGQENNRRQGYQERGGQQHRWQQRQWQGERGRRAYRPYGYSAPIYVPPPVVYPPYQSPGISLFFPFHFR